MRVLLIAFAAMSLFLATSAQEIVLETDTPSSPPDSKNQQANDLNRFEARPLALKDLMGMNRSSRYADRVLSTAGLFKAVPSGYTTDTGSGRAPKAELAFYDSTNQDKSKYRFNWKGAMVQSGLFLAIQHAFRMTEKKTRDELDGPFFSDWKDSVKNLEDWDDGGRFFTNYIAHPAQGAATSRIFINNSGKASRQEFGKNGDYWEGRLKAMAWSAIWSLQFEIGPISEASLGNVGQKRHADGGSKMTYEDIVLTPVLGTAFVVMEDVVDKYVLEHWLETKIKSHLVIKILRGLLTPTTSVANLMRGRMPWRRDYRFN